MAKYRNPNPSRIGTMQACKVCDKPFLKDHGRRVTCSDECQKITRSEATHQTRCAWCDKPTTQVVRDFKRGFRPTCSSLCMSGLAMLARGTTSSSWSPPKPVRPARPKPPLFREVRACAWCEEAFTAHNPVMIYCCSQHCSRATKLRRRGRQYGWDSHFTLAELMRVFHVFERCCAYCELPIEGVLPEPDHVVPLSKGGTDSITNILPSCHLCNSDKRDHLLQEWNADRERRGRTARTVSWPPHDPRVRHLTVLTS